MSSKGKGKRRGGRRAGRRAGSSRDVLAQVQDGPYGRTRLLRYLSGKASLSRDCLFVPCGLPETLVIPMMYTTRFSVDAATDCDNVFAGNGLYDPDVTGTGHQPYLFDQFIALYERYRVIKSSIALTYSPVATTAAGSVFVGVAATTWSTSLEGGGLNNYDTSLFKYVVTNGTGSQFAARVTREDPTAAVLDIDRFEVNLYGTSGANPSLAWYYHCYLCTTDATTLLSGQAQVHMCFLAEFSRRALVGVSATRPPKRAIQDEFKLPKKRFVPPEALCPVTTPTRRPITGPSDSTPPVSAPDVLPTLMGGSRVEPTPTVSTSLEVPGVEPAIPLSQLNALISGFRELQVAASLRPQH